ncbi:MAG: hypothetical protein RIG61_13280 [Deltaproteobacteria bacterium]
MKTRASAANALMILGLFVLAALILIIPESRAQNTEAGQVTEDKVSVINRVEPQYVCMVNNQTFAKEQIPVVIDEKTYYGCCEMCEGRLKADPESRHATDPVSGNKVDKATAIIGAAPDGKVYYFENLENLETYSIN